ncbi:hypothetical protein [Qipengyuania sp. JC766]|uniref:hypothetical protein n=1 Tax=Qipengyuania sp. JC766 TaxID=3232139 RepID=UPI003459DF54
MSETVDSAKLEQRLRERAARREASGGSMQVYLGIALSAFLLGGLVIGYFAWQDGTFLSREAETVPDRVGPENPGAALVPTLPSPTRTAADPEEEPAEAVERVEEQQGGIEQRLAAAEQRLSRLDLQTQAASGNAARAEGLLIAFAARRALERGARLGFLAEQLQLRFGDANPQAVETIIANSRRPVTIDQLIARLDGLAPELRNASNEPTFERLQREFGELFVIRRQSAPSPQPERRLERARLFLETRRVGPAISEVEQLPGAQVAENWIADARRYAATMRALDLLETTAVLEPRRLRDRTGQPIEQPSPLEQLDLDTSQE